MQGTPSAELSSSVVATSTQNAVSHRDPSAAHQIRSLSKEQEERGGGTHFCGHPGPVVSHPSSIFFVGRSSSSCLRAVPHQSRCASGPPAGRLYSRDAGVRLVSSTWNTAGLAGTCAALLALPCPELSKHPRAAAVPGSLCQVLHSVAGGDWRANGVATVLRVSLLLQAAAARLYAYRKGMRGKGLKGMVQGRGRESLQDGACE